MKKLFLLVAIATTISFAACTNTKTTEQTEETATELTDVTVEQTPVEADSTNTVEEVVAEDAVVESVN